MVWPANLIYIHQPGKLINEFYQFFSCWKMPASTQQDKLDFYSNSRMSQIPNESVSKE